MFSLFSQTVSVGRRKFSANFQLVFRLIKGMIFLTIVSILVTLIAIPHMTMQDIIVCILAFMPTGWGMLLVRYPSPLSLISSPWFLWICPYISWDLLHGSTDMSDTSSCFLSHISTCSLKCNRTQPSLSFSNMKSKRSFIIH